MPWKFHHGGQSWDLDDLTGEELEALEDQLGCRYVDLQPGLKARDTLAILATFMSRKLSEDQVEKAIKKMTLKSIRDCWSFTVEDSLPSEFEEGLPDPKAGAGPGTSTSSSSPATRGGGRRTSRDASPSGT